MFFSPRGFCSKLSSFQRWRAVLCKYPNHPNKKLLWRNTNMSWRCFAHMQSLWKCNDLSYTIRELGWYWGLWVLWCFLYVQQNAPGKIIWILHYQNTRWILKDTKEATCMSIFKPIKWCDRTTYDETLARSIKQSTWAKRERKNKDIGSKSKLQEQNPNMVTRGAKEQVMFFKALISRK